MDKTALILMTTYNGEKYLPQQINSIIDQTHQNWKLIIRDDGSSDSTLDILISYEEKDQRIIHIQLESVYGCKMLLTLWYYVGQWIPQWSGIRISV